MKYILIRKDDRKSKSLMNEIERFGIKIKPMPGSAIFTPFYILTNYFKFGKPRAVVYRYLNDSNSLLRTLIRLFAEISGIIICQLLGTKIIWICHNIDRESVVNHPYFTRIRRRLFIKYSKKILVTDPMLINYAKKTFPLKSQDIEYITFGKVFQNPVNKNALELTKEIEIFVKKEKQKKIKEKLLFGLCCGSPNWKTSHFLRIPFLLGKVDSDSASFSLRMIVIGPLSSYYSKNNPTLINFLKKNPQVLFIDANILIPEVNIAKYIDFFWRASKDISMPFTIYHAASLKKPILAQGPGFTAEAVQYYSLGAVINQDFSNIDKALEKIEKWDSKNADNFLRTHNWSIAAEKLMKICM